MKVQLTDRFCAHAKALGEAQTDYFDATISGLALRVTAQGTKAWTLLHGTPRRRVTLGRYPAPIPCRCPNVSPRNERRPDSGHSRRSGRHIYKECQRQPVSC